MTSIQSGEDVNRDERYVERKDAEDSGFEREVLKRWQLPAGIAAFLVALLSPGCCCE